jgi:hypothetical protein
MPAMRRKHESWHNCAHNLQERLGVRHTNTNTDTDTFSKENLHLIFDAMDHYYAGY